MWKWQSCSETDILWNWFTQRLWQHHSDDFEVCGCTYTHWLLPIWAIISWSIKLKWHVFSPQINLKPAYSHYLHKIVYHIPYYKIKHTNKKWNLEKWYRWAYLQSRNRDADVENGCVDTGGDGEGGVNWEMGTDIYTLPYTQDRASGKLLYSRSSAQCSMMT